MHARRRKDHAERAARQANDSAGASSIQVRISLATRHHHLAPGAVKWRRTDDASEKRWGVPRCRSPSSYRVDRFRATGAGGCERAMCREQTDLLVETVRFRSVFARASVRLPPIRPLNPMPPWKIIRGTRNRHLSPGIVSRVFHLSNNDGFNEHTHTQECTGGATLICPEAKSIPSPL
jgi:hypothetical protein